MVSGYKVVDGSDMDKWAKTQKYFNYGEEHKQGYGYPVHEGDKPADSEILYQQRTNTIEY